MRALVLVGFKREADGVGGGGARDSTKALN